MSTGKILCFGDSNTYGYDPRGAFGGRYSTGNRWCGLLGEELQCRTVNLGENGSTIPAAGDFGCQILSRSIRRERPDLLLILLGTNDILMGTGTPERIAGQMEALISQLRRDFPELKILLLSPPQIAVSEFSSCAAALSALYCQAARRQGIDFLDSFSWKVPLAFDGVHFSEAGHHAFARHLSAALKRQIKYSRP